MTEVPELQPAVSSRLKSGVLLNVWGLPLGALFYWVDPKRSAFILLVFVVPAVQGLVSGLLGRRALKCTWSLPAPWPRDIGTRFDIWIAHQKSHVTNALALAIAMVAVCQVLSAQSSIDAAGLVKQAVRDGAVWRMLTAGLLHGAPWHFVGNVLALLALGRTVEILAHWSRLAIVFLASILAGSAFSVVFLPTATSVGASGGIMGLLGFLVVLSVRQKRTLPAGYTRSLIGGVLWVGLTGVVAYAVIDNAAHLGGLLAGLGLGWCLVPSDRAVPLAAGSRLRVAGLAAIAVLALTAIACGMILVWPRR